MEYAKGSLKDKQEQPHKRTKIFILGNPHGEENLAKIPLHRYIKSTKTRPQTCAPSPSRYVSLSLSYALYTSECVF